MDIFLKTAGGILIALILWICLNKYNKENGAMLSMAVCAMVITAGIAFLEPVVSFLKKLQIIGNMDEDLLAVVFKTVGIGLIGEISMLICKDAGNESMGKALQILSTIVVLWMSLPVFEKLLSLLDKMLGSI